MNLKNLLWISAFLTSCAFSTHTQEQSFEQLLDHLWAEYKKKSELFNTNLQPSFFTSAKDFNRACIELQELTQALDHIIAYAIEKGEYKGSLKIILDEHKASLDNYMQVGIPMLADYTRDSSIKVKMVAERIKSMKANERFYMLMKTIGEAGFLVSSLYITITSDSNATLSQVNGIALTALIASSAWWFVFYMLHGTNSDAQANVRNYIREHNLEKAKELEGWEKNSGKQLNLDTNV